MGLTDEFFLSLPSNGWLSRPEAELLWRLARMTKGDVLEVGTYHGRSTCLLARAVVRQGVHRTVFTVDPFAGFDDGDPDGSETGRRLMANLTDRNIQNVVSFRRRIEDWEARPVGFAYLDGDHTREGTLAQVKKVLECGARVIAVHDVNDKGDGVQVRDACVEMLGPWRERVERLAWWEVKQREQAT